MQPYIQVYISTQYREEYQILGKYEYILEITSYLDKQTTIIFYKLLQSSPKQREVIHNNLLQRNSLSESS